MKRFWRYIFPVVFGLLIYTSIRLVNDTTANERFWERPWQTTTIELASVVVISYIIQWSINRLIRYFKNKEDSQFNTKSILKEFGWALMVTLFIIHLTIIPMMIFTDDGMQLNDYVIGNIIPTLFVMLYFAIVRGNQYLKNYVGQKIQLEKLPTTSCRQN